MTSRFVDGLCELDARTTRARLTAALAAVEGDLLRAARDAVSRLDAALRDADRPPVPSVLDDESIHPYIRRMMRDRMEADAAGGRP